jgi:hypothetical protein
MFHWTEHNIRVHVFTCVLALQIAHQRFSLARDLEGYCFCWSGGIWWF